MTEQAAGRPPTSAEVAARAGLSRSAVSQILNGHGERFPQDTRDRVLAAAEELGYRPSRAARALVNGVTDLIVLVLPDTTFGTNLQDCVDIISTRAAMSGLSVFVRYNGSDLAGTLSAILDLRPTAVIDFAALDARDRATLTAAGITVMPKTTGPEVEDLDRAIGRQQATEVLRVPGRRLVYALVSDDRLDPFGPRRLKGVTDEAARLGISPPVVIRVPLELSGAVSALSAAASSGEPLGVCCYNDDVAIAVLAAAREMSLAVPETVAIIGVDHTAIGQLVAPRLTTIALDLPALTHAFADELGLHPLETPLGVMEPTEPLTVIAGNST